MPVTETSLELEDEDVGTVEVAAEAVERGLLEATSFAATSDAEGVKPVFTHVRANSSTG